MKTIVALHGWGQSRAAWDNFARAFPDGTVVTIDLPGFGSEPRPEAAWGVPEYAAWIRARVERDGLADVVLLGHSFGGRVAASLAADRPAWLAGLVLYGAPCLYRPAFSIRARNALARWSRPARALLPARLKPRDLRDAEMSGLGDIFRRVVGFDQADRLPRIAVPTLLAWGRDDREVPLAVAETMRDLIPGSELAIIDHAGHNAHLDAPTLFYGIVRTFVDRL